MDENVMSFRCPDELLSSVEELCRNTGVSKSSVIVAAMRRMNAEVKKRDNRLVPPYKPNSVKLPGDEE